MKKCSYCGRESEDVTRYCSACGSPFAEATAAATAREKPPLVLKPIKEGECSYCGIENAAQSEYCSGCGSRLNPTSVATVQESFARLLPSSKATDPANPWSARDAWKCLGMFVVFELVIGAAWRAIETALPGFRFFSGTGAGHLTYSLVHYAAQILNVLYFARTETFQSFLKTVGLTTGPSRYAWFAVAMTLIIRSAGHLIVTTHLSRGVTSPSLWGFAHSMGFERVLYLAPALIAPFAEELYMRGFFYRAFRGNYSVIVSTLLILGIMALTHWYLVSRSWAAALDIGAITILQCYLRERTGNLWDCIISHFVFNATGAFLSLRAY
jgi:membrane protease YdiL (CAAX protease family)